MGARMWMVLPADRAPRHGRLARSCAPRENWKALGYGVRFRRNFKWAPKTGAPPTNRSALFIFLDETGELARVRFRLIARLRLTVRTYAAVRIVEFYSHSRFHPRDNQFETPLLLHNASHIAMISPERSGNRFICKQIQHGNLYRCSNLPHSFILSYQFLYGIEFSPFSLPFSLYYM